MLDCDASFATFVAALLATSAKQALAMPNGLPEARNFPRNWGPAETVTVTAQAAETITANSGVVTVTVGTTTAQTITSNVPFSTMSSSEIMDMYSSMASNVNNAAMASMSSIMWSAQQQNDQYYYYANWYISSNAAASASSSGPVATVTTVTA